MKHHVLSRAEQALHQYKQEHRGESPLYILVTPEESNTLMAEVKEKDHHAQEIVVTEYQGSKIVGHDNLNPGEILLTNELPETGS
jgi:hypothetical protein